MQSGDICTKELELLIKQHLHCHSYRTAQFFADKLVQVAPNASNAQLLAETYMCTKQYKRAYHVLHTYNDHKSKLLSVKCLEEIAQWEAILHTLHDEDDNIFQSWVRSSGDPCLSAALCVSRAKAHDMLDNAKRARACYQLALSFDPTCFEAYDRLIQEDSLLSAKEQSSLLQSLHFKPSSLDWIKPLYRAMQRKLPPMLTGSSCSLQDKKMEGEQQQQQHNENPLHPSLAQNADVKCAQAQYFLDMHDYEHAYECSKKLIENDRYQQECLPIYLSCMVYKKQKSDLFLLSHQLVENNPNSALSWYAVGCYYMCIQKYELARKYFLKSSGLEKRFLPAYMGLAHSLAYADESEQAISAYRTIYKQFPGCWLAPLYIAMESLKTNQLPMCDFFLLRAKELAPDNDPLLYNEVGCLHYKQRQYEDAMRCFTFAKSLISNQPSMLKNSEWEPILFNLAHTCRNLKLYDKAILNYEQALYMSPKLASIYSCLALTYHLIGNISKAIEFYHKSLAHENPHQQDSLTAGLLSKALEQLSDLNVDQVVL